MPSTCNRKSILALSHKIRNFHVIPRRQDCDGPISSIKPTSAPLEMLTSTRGRPQLMEENEKERKFMYKWRFFGLLASSAIQNCGDNSLNLQSCKE